ncbi:adenylate cyclase-like protein [Pterulicium gracile]|uniref:Adenylate cyclase n=1 Tax=Pterulicium gracile TaxID=1884261 RepID=A0A5C3QXA8_9AGAR|nr:adenylate cyclase-like protein [Pterula gracilis]
MDPFSKRNAVTVPREPDRAISPTTASTSLPNGEAPTWTAPESWAVDPLDGGEEPTLASSDEEVENPATKQANRKSKRMTLSHQARFKIRVYTASGTYHVLALGLHTTVEDLMPDLNKALLPDKGRQTHRLHLREKGRERLLASTERPAHIVRRRLEQAGYESTDGLECLGEEGLSFLLKFIFKSLLIGSPEDDMNFHSFTNIDLSSRALRAIPAVLHAKAEKIQKLVVSRNPMLEIPLDFVQSCANLHWLEMAHMSMKKIPDSVRAATSLERLDVSCNRIADLGDGLDRIEHLQELLLQNNRMENLPWYLPRLRSLHTLNMSNNKFKLLPSAVCQIQTLETLDVSFNTITELPEHIGQMRSLRKLILVGNQISAFPSQISELKRLEELDCRRNLVTDLTIVCMLEGLQSLRADHNTVHALDLSIGSRMSSLDVSHNDITRISLLPGPIGKTPYNLVSLDISYAKLSSLDDLALSQLTSLQTLKLDHNALKILPDSICNLTSLVTLQCSYGSLTELPVNIGNLHKLEFLDLHCNSLKQLPPSLWNCASLRVLSVASNLLKAFPHPPETQVVNIEFAANENLDLYDSDIDEFNQFARPTGWVPIRKTSTASVLAEDPLPPLSYSLLSLLAAENQFNDDTIPSLYPLKKVQTLNLSFNDVASLPAGFFQCFSYLDKLYLSGNKLATIPTDGLAQCKLSVLFLNGNRLTILPHDLGKIQTLSVLDVGSNILKYNIYNWEYDWNWNFNKNLRYLNLSGNKRLQIKSDVSMAKEMQLSRSGARPSTEATAKRGLGGFKGLDQLRVLGLMDVTITTTDLSTDIPDENEDRRVRTSQSVVNGMPYGIADNLGLDEHVNMFDLAQENRSQNSKESVFAMFGRAHPIANHNNRIARWLSENLLRILLLQLSRARDRSETTVVHTMRRTFLTLHKNLHDYVYQVHQNGRKMSQASSSTSYSSREKMAHLAGASGIVIYFMDRTMYVANVGNCLAVVSRHGVAQSVSRKHDPFDRSETARIRRAEGWVSPDGSVNGELDISRSFGFYSLFPVVNARPDVHKYDLTDLDEFVIVANRGLWDHMSYQTAVDIARTESADPMLAACKLRDIAVSYGAEGSTMIMVVGVGSGPNFIPRSVRPQPVDLNLSRLPYEVEPPTGHLALAFTDIVNSTHLWEVNPGMNTAMRIHNNVLRRQLRLCGGYEVKTEGDAFICSFPTALAAVWWCLSSQVALIHEEWPLEILECEDGKEVVDSLKRVISRGLAVRMGIHCGAPLCEPDPNTGRMDYFGPIVNRTARIMANANGGQVMCSNDVIREINAKILQTESDTEFIVPQRVIDGVKDIGISMVYVGERKLKGLEVPEMLSIIYPSGLEGRTELKEPRPDPGADKSRIQFSIAQMKRLGVLCLRLEALSASQVFQIRSSGANAQHDGEPEDDFYITGDPESLLPVMSSKSSDAELMALLQNFSVRIENAVGSLAHRHRSEQLGNLHTVLSGLRLTGQLDLASYQEILSVL